MPPVFQLEAVLDAAAASEVTEPGPPRRMSRLNRLISPQAMEEANARSTSKQSVAKAASRSPPAPGRGRTGVSPAMARPSPVRKPPYELRPRERTNPVPQGRQAAGCC